MAPDEIPLRSESVHKALLAIHNVKKAIRGSLGGIGGNRKHYGQLPTALVDTSKVLGRFLHECR